MTSSRLRAVVLAIAAGLLAGCATKRSDGAPCPPVGAYSQEFLARAADELDSLSPGSAIEQMLADYQVMRDQAQACRRFGEHNFQSLLAMWRRCHNTVVKALAPGPSLHPHRSTHPDPAQSPSTSWA